MFLESSTKRRGYKQHTRGKYTVTVCTGPYEWRQLQDKLFEHFTLLDGSGVDVERELQRRSHKGYIDRDTFKHIMRAMHFPITEGELSAINTKFADYGDFNEIDYCEFVSFVAASRKNRKKKPNLDDVDIKTVNGDGYDGVRAYVEVRRGERKGESKEEPECSNECEIYDHTYRVIRPVLDITRASKRITKHIVVSSENKDAMCEEGKEEGDGVQDCAVCGAANRSEKECKRCHSSFIPSRVCNFLHRLEDIDRGEGKEESKLSS